MVTLGGLLLAGLYVEGWAHNHRKLDILLFNPTGVSPAFTPPGLPSALTAWHLLFHTAFLTASAVLIATVIRRRQRGYPWRQALPSGYDLAPLGILLMLAGAVGDLLTHGPSVVSIPDIAPGLPRFEALPALLSPTRLGQAVGIAFVVSSPLRAAWLRRTEAPNWRSLLPALLALTYLVSLFSYMTQFAHPLVDLWPEISFWRRGLQTYRYGQFFFGESMGVLSIAVQTALLMGPALLVVRRWALPTGSLTLVFGLNALLMSVLQDRYLFVLSAVGAGLVADFLAKRMAPSIRPWEFRIFAATVPAVYYALYFLTLVAVITIESPLGPSTAQLEGIGWSVELRAGATLLAALIGWLLSYLVMPPTSEHSQKPS